MFQSYLLISQNKEDSRKYILELAEKNNVKPLDVSYFEEEKAFGIEKVRLLQRKVFLKPLYGKMKICSIIADSITLEAQNALLKLLEEPPNNTTILLAVSKLDSIIDTIISRCKVIEFGKEKKLNHNIDENVINVIKRGTSGEKLVLAESFGKDKTVALAFLEYVIQALSKELFERTEKRDSDTKKLVAVLKRLQKTYSAISSSNVNPRFALEVVLLDFSHLL